MCSKQLKKAAMLSDSGNSHLQDQGSLLQINSSVLSLEKIVSGILQAACRRAEGPTGISTYCVPPSRVECGDVVVTPANERACLRPVVSIQDFLMWDPKAESPLLPSDCRTHWDSPEIARVSLDSKILPEVPKPKGTEFIVEALEMLSLYSRDSLEHHLGSARCVFNHEF